MTEERIETLEKRVTTLEGLLADCMFQLDTVLSQPKAKGVAIPKAKGMAKQQRKTAACGKTQGYLAGKPDSQSYHGKTCCLS